MPDIFISMIKQNWNISTDEAKRILMMHESATKNQYLINEQRQETITTTEQQQNKFPLTNLGDKFEYGKYDSPSVKLAIEQLKPQIEEFIKKSDSSNFTINISAGESQVTNPKGFETKGSLALARANSVKKYFEEIFPDLIRLCMRSNDLRCMHNSRNALRSKSSKYCSLTFVGAERSPPHITYPNFSLMS
jgi:hypothetical protein